MESLEYLMYVDEQEEKERIRNSELKEAYKNGLKTEKLKRERNYNKEIIKNATKINLTLEQISNIVSLPVNEVLIIQNEINNNQD